MDIQSHLKTLIDLEGSDLYISANAVPMVRVEGKISRLSDEELDDQSATQMIYSILSEPQIEEFEKNDLERVNDAISQTWQHRHRGSRDS